MYQFETPILEKLSVWAGVSPGKVAVQGDSTISYARLVQLSELVALRLAECKASYQDHIVCCFSQPEWTPVAILGIHSLGAAYVPLDAAFPDERIRSILQDTCPKVVFSDSEKIVGLAKTLGIEALCIGDDIRLEDAAVEPKSKQPFLGKPSDVSHIFYTSGTTGKPKGVVATQGNLDFYIQSAVDRYGFDQNDVFLSVARATFSISLFEILTPLLCGATLRVVRRENILDIGYLIELIKQVTVFHIGPALLKRITQEIDSKGIDRQEFSAVRHVSSGGDHVPADLLERLKDTFPRAEIFVIYGSSEISCMGCTYEVSRATQLTSTRVGKPFPKVSVKILDDKLLPVPVGSAGQLFFSGPGVTAGYLNQPDLTENKYIQIEGQLFYNIGDVGRVDSNGDIELLGRKDYQVKIRGIRIETAEIEQTLKRHVAIRDCVVTAYNIDPEEEKRLVGYVVLDSAEYSQIPSSIELTKHLANYLPEYMIPSIYIPLDQLPTNFNGKLDRSKLPAPNSVEALGSGECITAATEWEFAIERIWKDILKIERISVADSFFDLGGDSLSAIRFIDQFQEKFDIKLSFSQLVLYPSIRALAELVDSPQRQSKVDVVPLRLGQSDTTLYLLDGVVLYKDLVKHYPGKESVYAISFDNERDILQAGVNSPQFNDLCNFDNIVESYYAKITSHDVSGKIAICGHSFGGYIALDLSLRLLADGREVIYTGLIDTFAPNYQDFYTLREKIRDHVISLQRRGPIYLVDVLRRRAARRAKPQLNSELVNIAPKGRKLIVLFRNKAAESYLKKSYLLPVSAFAASDIPLFNANRDDLGWGRYIPNLTHQRISGSHMSMLEGASARTIAEIMSREISAAAGSNT